MTEQDFDGNCLLCLNKINIFAVTVCGHTTCHRCFLRMRLLYRNECCKFCRVEQNDVIFSKKMQPYSAFDTRRLSSFISCHCVCFIDTDMKKEIDKLLNYTCPISKCQQRFSGWSIFNAHLKKHSLYLCEVCHNHRKVFPDEIIYYKSDQLKIHNKKGDLSFRKDDQTGFTGHIKCEHCKIYLYGGTEFYNHNTKEHFECFVCNELKKKSDYYKDYNALELHFKSCHYLCSNRECLEHKFIVFDSKIKLKMHEKIHLMTKQLSVMREDPNLLRILTNTDQVETFSECTTYFNQAVISAEDYLFNLISLTNRNAKAIKYLLGTNVKPNVSNEKWLELVIAWGKARNQVS